jgi:hypothetical protein
LPLPPSVALFAGHVFRSYVNSQDESADSMGPPTFSGSLADCQKGENVDETRHDTAHYSGFYCAEI